MVSGMKLLEAMSCSRGVPLAWMAAAPGRLSGGWKYQYGPVKWMMSG
jgi:hypothetical protein